MKSKRWLSGLKFLQLIATVPTSLAALGGALLGIFGLASGAASKGDSIKVLVASALFIVPAITLVCLWRAILADDEVVAARKFHFRVVSIGIVVGCLLAGALVVLSILGSQSIASIAYDVVILVIGMWQLYRLSRIVWLPNNSLELR